MMMMEESLLVVLYLLLGVASADSSTGSGDEFSNNLFSDLAPLLALFGENMAKQYLSQSMHWLDNVIFASAPLGIVTALTSAIRVGGSGTLKAIIGRAREPHAEAEIELMSSTSQDVCELWNGISLVRVAGAPDVLEIAYDEDGNVYSSEDFVEPEGGFSRSDNESDEALINRHDKRAPNISLNTRGSGWRSLWELRIFAALGLALQTGVVAFHGVLTYHLRLGKGGNRIPVYSFPLTTLGTLLLFMGMYVCAYVVDASTHEATRSLKVKACKPQIVWIQRGGQKVSDQQFHSYAIYAARGRDRIHVSYPVNNRAKLEIWTLIGVGLSIPGFVLQFVGLRASHYSVSLAQLVAVGVMVVIKAAVRRDLMHGPKMIQYPHQLPEHGSSVMSLSEGYELECISRFIAGVRTWKIICYSGSTYPRGEPQFTAATKPTPCALDARIRLSALTGSMWETELHRIATILEQMLETTVNHLWSSKEKLTIRPEERDISRLSCELRVLTDSVTGCWGLMSLDMSRSRNEQKWDRWKVDTERFRAMLFMWVAQLHDDKLPSIGNNLWLLRPCDDEALAEIIASWWIFRQQDTIKVDARNMFATLREYGIEEDRILDHDRHGQFPRHAVVTKTSLNAMCAQYLLSEFFCALAKKIAPITSRTEVISTPGHPVLLANDSIRELAEFLQGTDLMSVDDTYRIVVSALWTADLLPWSEAALEKPALTRILEIALTTEISGQEEICSRLLYLCHRRTSELVERKRFDEVGRVFTRVISVFQHFKTESERLCLQNAISLVHNEVLLQRDTMARLTANSNAKSIIRNSTYTSINDGGYPLHYAARHGDAEGICNLISEHRPSLEIPDASGMTPLSLAAYYGYSDIVSVLLLLGASGSAALHYVAREGYEAMIPLLLLNGVSPDCVDSKGDTALHNAVGSKHLLSVKKLLEHKADTEVITRDGATVLHSAISHGNEAAVRLLLSHGANIEALGGRYLLTPFLWACKYGHPGIASLLVSHGAVTTAVDAREQTALHVACTKGHATIVSLLLSSPSHLVSKDAYDLSRRTALHIACESNQSGIVQLLIDAGVDLEVVNANGETPLHVACAKAGAGVVRLLLGKGARLEAENWSGLTPLHLAASGGKEATVRVLLERGAERGCVDKYNRTPAILARGKVGILRLLEGGV